MNPWVKEMLEQEAWNRKQLEELARHLCRAPQGSLRICGSAKEPQYYLYGESASAEKRLTYLRKEDLSQIKALSQKKYELRLRDALQKEQHVIETALRMLRVRGLLSEEEASLAAQTVQSEGKGRLAIDLFKTLHPGYRTLVDPLVLTDDQYAAQWLERMSVFASGEDFKSKSEFLLNNIYEKHECIYVYEPKLYLKGYGNVHPDFAVLRRSDRETVYHEHFGMMDDPDYCAKALAKLSDYHRNGFIEGDNLIITMESSQKPLDPREAEALILSVLER